jgi:hypothetical protein
VAQQDRGRVVVGLGQELSRRLGGRDFFYSFETIIALFCKITAFICYIYENILLTYSEVVIGNEREEQIKQEAW